MRSLSVADYLANNTKPEEGSLVALPLKDGFWWGLGQILKMDPSVEKHGVTWIGDFEIAVYKHVKVSHPKEIDGVNIPLKREDIVFIVTDDGFSLQAKIYYVLPFIREINIDFCEMSQYEVRKLNPNSSLVTMSADCALNAYFGLKPWCSEIYDDPKRNAAIKINGNIRPDNAILWEKPDPATIQSDPIYQFYLYFHSTDEMFGFCDEIEKLYSFSVMQSYPIPIFFKSQTLYEVMLSKIVCKSETLEELQEFLHKIAQRYNGFFETSIPWPKSSDQ